MGRGLALQSGQDFCGEKDQTSQKPFVLSEDTMDLGINVKWHELRLVISRRASDLQVLSAPLSSSAQLLLVLERQRCRVA